MCAKSLQSCLTLCSPMDCNPAGFSVDGILQARILEWVAMLPPGDLPNPGIKPASFRSSVLAGGFLTISTTWVLCVDHCQTKNYDMDIFTEHRAYPWTLHKSLHSSLSPFVHFGHWAEISISPASIGRLWTFFSKL